MARLLLVNFGGPREGEEIRPFLEELLCDRDVIWTWFPDFFHRWLFRRVAKKRAVKIQGDYERIGGRSPIFFDTEKLAGELGAMTFHRYLPATHAASLQAIEKCGEEIVVLPLFPQFTYATTGSIARFFAQRLSRETVERLRWIPSYPAHPAYVAAFQKKIGAFLEKTGLVEEETVLFFSAHGVPVSFIEKGDPYQRECEASFQAIAQGFPKALSRLAYQSKFGRGEWIRPYTIEAAEEIRSWHAGRPHVVFVPLTFTSDHIETLFEIEEQYLPPIRARGLNAYRCPALNLESYWIHALRILSNEKALVLNCQLIRS